MNIKSISLLDFRQLSSSELQTLRGGDTGKGKGIGKGHTKGNGGANNVANPNPNGQRTSGDESSGSDSELTPVTENNTGG